MNINSLTHDQYRNLKRMVAMIPNCRYETGISTDPNGVARLRVSALYETSHVLMAVHTWLGTNEVTYSANCTEIDITTAPLSKAVKCILAARDTIRVITGASKTVPTFDY